LNDDEYFVLTQFVDFVVGPPEMANDDNLVVAVFVEDDGVVRGNKPGGHIRHKRRPRIASDDALYLKRIGEQIAGSVTHKSIVLSSLEKSRPNGCGGSQLLGGARASVGAG